MKTDIRTGGHNCSRDKSIGNLFTYWMLSGMAMARARLKHFNGTVVTRIHDAKGEHKVKQSTMVLTDEWFEGGLVRSSEHET